ncbi:GDSL-type esterase/lipase family protein [Sphingomonas naphthae]|uniref:GDSL-type esterase/lipase family protein n=1 Tax=Sphingomonas naphthae TaxID=1813468 RepID=A0ABY7TJF1_9SPHN|nr:GDSL-type esterase/lipase family protein [Sphingomonas naphthae]WCT72449.1 GDSL-type esterase/lipase family protein [Sphingomonas naphthae]
MNGLVSAILTTVAVCAAAQPPAPSPRPPAPATKPAPAKRAPVEPAAAARPAPAIKAPPAPIVPATVATAPALKPAAEAARQAPEIAAPKPALTGPKAAMGPAAAPAFRFASEIDAFVRFDAVSGVEDAKTLFVGSSSVRMWKVKEAFPKMRVLNRGFGGATTPEVLEYYGKVVANHRPESVVIYVGDNDIAAGSPPADVATDVLSLLARLRSDMPKARIVYLSIKASPLRWSLWPKMVAVNSAVRAKSGPATFDYLDVSSALMGPDGHPDPRYFGPDGLHMNAEGYALWTALVDAYLAPIAPAAPNVGPTPIKTTINAPTTPVATADRKGS